MKISKTGLVKWLIILVITFFCVFPLYYVLMGATHDSIFIYDASKMFDVGSELKENLSTLNENFNVPRILYNSFVVSVVNAVLGIVVIFITAYALAMYDFKFKKIIFSVLLVSMMIPGNVIIINKFRLLSMVNMTDSYLGLILPTVLNIHILLLMKRNLEYIDRSTMNAAIIDGANDFQVMMRVGLPAVKSYIYIGIFNLFVQSLNNYLLPLLIVNRQDFFTLPLLISSMADPLRFKYGAVFLALAILSIPQLLLLLVMSKHMFRKVN